MDEIIIEEKRYISSKQAAKITGYAKDYVGQLCREGRIPARLVGRSWYVLESAIKDHRFGDQVIDQKNTMKTTPQENIPLQSSAFPRYESSPVEVLPTLSHPQESESPEKVEKMTPLISQNLHDSWKEWFDTVSKAPTPSVAEEPSVPMLEQEDGAENVPITSYIDENKENEQHIEEEDVPVPLHTFNQPLPHREFLPRDLSTETVERREFDAEEEIVPIRRRSNANKTVVRVFQTMGILFAGVAVVLALFGSGYFDNYLISHNQATFISGLSIYNK